MPDIPSSSSPTNIHHVFQVADRIVVMRRGEVIAGSTSPRPNLIKVESIITGAAVSELLGEANAWRSGRSIAEQDRADGSALRRRIRGMTSPATPGMLSQFAGVRLMTLGDGVERGIR